MAEVVEKTRDVNRLIEYIEKCIDLKCKIIKIHPFADGNGRSSRALLNICFRRVNLPPTYVTVEEKPLYIDAMDKAIRCDDQSAIRKFYYYKICDSIFELDIKPRIGIKLEEEKTEVFNR
jgi:fido (protein-threonine AMPylation protein)